MLQERIHAVGAIEENFFSHLSKIKQLRQVDQDFDEICRDYEHLTALLSNDENQHVAAVIQDSISGLEVEIRQFISLEAVKSELKD